MLPNGDTTEPVIGTPFDLGDGWEGDSGGAEKISDEERAALSAGRESVTDDTTGDPSLGDPNNPSPDHYEASEEDEALRAENDDERLGKTPDQPRDPNTGKWQSKKKQTWQERQAEEQAKLAATKGEREAEETAVGKLRAERQELETMLAELRASRETTDAKTGEKATTENVDKVGDEPLWEDYDAQGKTFKEWQTDYSKWLRTSIKAEMADAKAAAREVVTEHEKEREAKAQAEKLETEFDARLAETRKKFPELDEKAKALNFKSKFLSTVVFRHPKGTDLYAHLAYNPAVAKTMADMPWTQPFLTAVRESDDPVALLTHLAENRTEFERIHGMHPTSALYALGRIDASLRREGVTKSVASPSSPARVTKAAPPLRQLAGRSSSTGGNDDFEEKHPDDWTPADAERIRKADYRR